MASHKPLKSVVRSLAESFTSLMNYWGDDYVMGHIVFAAWESGGTELRVDFLNGKINPSLLLAPKVRESIASYIDWFPKLVQQSNSDLQFLAEAELLVVVDPNKRRNYLSTQYQESPFKCTVSKIDDRGRV